MNYVLIALTCISLTLIYCCIFFNKFSKTNDLSELLAAVIYDDIVIGVMAGGIALALLCLFFEWIKYLIIKPKVFAQRISVDEYEKQKQDYTKLKVNQLINSKEYQEFVKKSY